MNAGLSAPSFAQEELWYQQRLESDPSTYNEYAAYHVRGPLDRHVLASAVGAVAARHESFRHAFVASSDGELAITVRDEPYFPFAFSDLTALGPSDQSTIERFLRETIVEPFDLAAGKLARARLFRVRHDHHVFVFVIHHLIRDGLSQGLLLKEISEWYGARRAGRDFTLPSESNTPVHWAEGRRAMQEGDAAAEGLRFWTRELEGAVPVEIAGDHPRPPHLESAGRTVTSRLPRVLRERLRARAHEEGASFFLLLLTAYGVLLGRYGNTDDVPIGFPVAGHDADVDDFVGCTINMLVFRARIDRHASFRSLLRRAKTTYDEALRYRDVPFARVVAALNPRRRSDQSPVFSTIASLVARRRPALDLTATRCEELRIDLGTAKADVLLEMTEDDGGLALRLIHRSTIYDVTTAERILAHYIAILERVADEPDAAVGRIRALDPAQEQLVLERWNATGAPCLDEPFHLRILAHAAATPEKVAVVAGDGEVTYGEIARASATLAARLRASGAGPGSRVAIFLDRGVAEIVAIVAVLRIGAAYVPLDIANPVDRLRAIFEDAAPSLVVSSRAVAAKVGFATAPLLFIDDEGEARDAVAGDEPEPFDPAAEAYILFTSGSSGRPKGVAVTLGSLVNVFAGMNARLRGSASMRVAAMTTPSFDMAVLERFHPLALGGTLLIFDAATTRDARRLAEAIDRFEPTHLQATPQTWRMLEAAGWRGNPNLCVLSGGEALPRDLADSILERCGRLWNGYGPTEATIYTTVDEVTRDGGAITIGRPLENTRCYILDEDREPVPAGVAGELYIGGAGVARGYVNRPDLTAERFVQSPFIADDRLYRTGDVVRYRNDGALLYLGRNDDQVKLRGFRIELGEIEAVLRAQPRIVDAVALLDDAPEGESRLVAYVVIATGILDVPALRAALAEKLPAYFIPAAFVRVATIPMTPNGKRDRRALAQSRLATPAGEAPVNPATTLQTFNSVLEDQVARVWEGLLGTIPDPDTDFFEAGGHSLLAARLCTRVAKSTGVEIPLGTFIKRPTINGIVATILAGAATPPSLATLYNGERTGKPLFFLHNDAFGGFYVRTIARELSAGRPVWAFLPHGSLGEAMPPTVEAMAADFYRQIRAIEPHGPYALAGHCLGGWMAVEVARMLRDAGAQVDATFVIDAPPTSAKITPALEAFDAVRAALGLPKRMTTAFAQLLRLPDRIGRIVSQYAYERALGHSTLAFFRQRLGRRGGGGGEDDARAAIHRHLSRASDRFGMRRYPGSITVILGEDGMASAASLRYWRRAAAHVDAHVVPGDHFSVVTRHAGEIAAIFSRRLEPNPNVIALDQRRASIASRDEGFSSAERSPRSEILR